MRLLEHLVESKNHTVCIFPGGFHPWTPGHTAVYSYLRDKFPAADLYVASSNKTSERPFSFDEKRFLAVQAGVPFNRFIEVKSPYKSDEITKNYEPTNTNLVFGLSSKDKDRLGSPIKKNGELAYMQPYPVSSTTPLETFDKHAYYIVFPSIKYKILGQDISSASKIRDMYSNGSETERYQIIQELYPKSTKVNKIKEILDRVLKSDIISEHIRKLKNGKYRLLSHKGKNLGTFDSRIAAAKHEGEVNYFKTLKETVLICLRCDGKGFTLINGKKKKCATCHGKKTINVPTDYRQRAANDLNESVNKNDRIVKFILTHCKKILKIYEDSNWAWLYNGTKKYNSPVFLGNLVKNREPRDTNSTVSLYIDKALQYVGFKALRSNSLFCISDKKTAASYGNIYIIFPLDGFSYTWCRIAADLTGKYDLSVVMLDDADPTNVLYGSEFVHNLMTMTSREFTQFYRFTDNAIIDAIDYGYEIYIHGKYIAVSIGNTELLKTIIDSYNRII